MVCEVCCMRYNHGCTLVIFQDILLSHVTTNVGAT
jgi:hypothetical protein